MILSPRQPRRIGLDKWDRQMMSRDAGITGKSYLQNADPEYKPAALWFQYTMFVACCIC